MHVKNWEQILSRAGCAGKEARAWAPFFAKHCKQFGLINKHRIAAFVGNIVVESNYLRVLRENLKYSARGLARTWPSRYSSTGRRGGSPNAKALAIAGKPEAIANHCYANRMGNGNEASGDGWKYSGKGPIQITGKDNYQKFFKSVNLPPSTNPAKLLEPDLGVMAAMWFWKTNNISASADKGNMDNCADLVNIGHKTREVGDAHGYGHRKRVYDNVLSLLNTNPKLLEAGRQLVIDDKEMDAVIPPEITTIDEDPDNEYGIEHLKEVEVL